MIFALEYDFLSNFYPSPLKYRDKVIPTVEHAFQASKVKDQSWKEQIIKSHSPLMAKRLGRKCPLIREDWNIVRVGCMKHWVKLKFEQHPDLMERLLKVKDPIIEHNWWHDNFWGYCKCDKCKDKKKLNHLGKILTEIRDGNL